MAEARVVFLVHTEANPLVPLDVENGEFYVDPTGMFFYKDRSGAIHNTAEEAIVNSTTLTNRLFGKLNTAIDVNLIPYDTTALSIGGTTLKQAVDNLDAAINGGSQATIMRTNQAATKTAGNLALNDNVQLDLGTGKDVKHFWTNSNYITKMNSGQWFIKDSADVNRFIFNPTNGNFTAGGYVFSSYVNMSHGSSSRVGDSIFYSSNDNFIRKNTATGFRASLSVFSKAEVGANYLPTATDGIKTAGVLRLNNNVPLELGSASNAVFRWINNTLTTSFLTNGSWSIKDKVGVEQLGMDTATGNMSLAGNLTAKGVNSSIKSGGSSVIFKQNSGGLNSTIGSGINLHLDSPDAGAIHMNFYGGNGGVIFNDGNGSEVGRVSAAGTITVTGDVIGYSDARLKENVEVIPDALAKVSKVSGYTFTRNDKEDTTTRHAGVLAQEIKEILPESVELTESGMYGVNYGSLVSILIEAVKELNTKVDELSAQVNGV